MTAWIALCALLLPVVATACGGAASPAPPSASVTPTIAVTRAVATQPVASASPTSAATGGATAPGGIASGVPDPRGAAPTKRGGGGTLHLLYWQAPSIVSIHRASGTKDTESARPVLEPLAVTSLDSSLPNVPVLAKSIPSAADGSVAADGKSVTWKLKDGLKWSDGSPVTAGDVKATAEFIQRPESAATTTAQYGNIAAIETPDASTVKITFKEATALWYTPFTNVTGAIMQKAQMDACKDPKACGLDTTPIGTGPYKVKSFTPGDNVQYAINDAYREANAPFFDAVDLKGGGDAGTAAKAVQTGQVDFAWNLQVTPDISKQITDAGKKLDQGPGFGVEQIVVNVTDPSKEVDGEKSSVKAPHPFLTDPKVREAMSWLVDRENIAKGLYAAAKPTCNILLGIPAALQSRNTKCGYDVAKANQLLEDAGWKKGPDGIRAKDGVKLQLTFATSVNPVREKEQQVIKQGFGQAGIGVDIKNGDPAAFFGTADNPDQYKRFEKDIEMFTTGPSDPDPQDFLQGFTTAQIPQKANGWQFNNVGRWSSAEYDALFGQLLKERNPEKRALLAVQMNDLIAGSYTRIPMVDRYSNNGYRADLINTSYTPWDAALWNIAYWQLKK